MNSDVEFVQNKIRRNFEIFKTFRVANRDEPQRVNTLMEAYSKHFYSHKVSMMILNENSKHKTNAKHRLSPTHI